jgi:hypothetical protein
MFSVGDVLDRLLAERRELSRGVPVGHLATRWTEVVGERLAAVSRPSRLERGTLVVATDTGPWGAQVGFLAEEIRGRANELLGGDVVKKVQVTVAPPPPRPEPR